MPIKTITTFSLIILATTQIIAQTNTNERKLNANYEYFDKYYVDEMGLQATTDLYPLNDTIDPESYILGSYDVISIYGIGLTNFFYRNLLINSQGDVITPLAGKINLNGYTINEAEIKLNSTFKTYVNETKIYLSLDKPRDIFVSVTGQIEKTESIIIKSGTQLSTLFHQFINPSINEKYASNESSTVSDLSRLVAVSADNNEQFNSYSETEENTLEQVSFIYDIRNIVIKRGVKSITADLFAFFITGDSKYDVTLSNNDVIVFSEKNDDEPTISISGAVNKPFVTSYKNSDSFTDLIEYSRGFHVSSDTNNIIRIRNLNDTTIREIFTLNELKNQVLLPNDSYVVASNNHVSKSKGTIEVIGEVRYPGIYPITEGQSNISDILSLAGGLAKNASPKAAYIDRTKINEDYPINTNYNYNLNDIIRNYDQYIEGLTYLQIEQNILNNNQIAVDLSNPKLLDNTYLFNNDKLIIPKDSQSIKIIGQVNNPGTYRYINEGSLNDYIKLANGLTSAADDQRIFVIKAGNRSILKPDQTQIQSGDIIFVDRVLISSYTEYAMLEINKRSNQINNRNQFLTIISILASTFTTLLTIKSLQ